MYSTNQRPAAADFTRQPKPERKAPVPAGAGAAGRSVGLVAGTEATLGNWPFRLTGPFAKMVFTTRPQNVAEHSRYMLAVEDWCHAETGEQCPASDNSEPAHQLRRAALLASRIAQVG